MIIGAMKAGTTSLREDLAANPAIFMAPKEPVHFAFDDVLTESGRRGYASQFSTATRGQICGAVSSGSASLPEAQGVPRRARTVLGPELKVIYLVRDPVERAVSHHRALLRAGEAGLDVDRELVHRPCYAQLSRYAMQIEPWVDEFGPANIVIVWFERYVAQRCATVAAVSQTLGVPPRPDLIFPDAAYNRAADKLVMPWYGLPPPVLRGARVVVPGFVKSVLRRVVPRRQAPRKDPCASTVRRFRELVREDLERFYAMLALREPLWPDDGALPAEPRSALLPVVGATDRARRDVVDPVGDTPAEPGRSE